MSCKNCDCSECESARDYNSCWDTEAPIHRPRWQDAEPANEVQAKAWGEAAKKYALNCPGNSVLHVAKVVAAWCHVRDENSRRVKAQIERFIRESPDFMISPNDGTHVVIKLVPMARQESMLRGMKPMDALDMVDRKRQEAAERYADVSPRTWAMAAKVADEMRETLKKAGYIAKPGTMTMQVHDEVTVQVETINDHTCKCGNTKCNKTEKSCWRCGEPIT